MDVITGVANKNAEENTKHEAKYRHTTSNLASRQVFYQRARLRKIICAGRDQTRKDNTKGRRVRQKVILRGKLCRKRE